jgi:hypothetical protein
MDVELENCKWADNGKEWKLVEDQRNFDDDSEILVPSSHPDSDAELEKEPVIPLCATCPRHCRPLTKLTIGRCSFSRARPQKKSGCNLKRLRRLCPSLLQNWLRQGCAQTRRTCVFQRPWYRDHIACFLLCQHLNCAFLFRTLRMKSKSWKTPLKHSIPAIRNKISDLGLLVSDY